MPPQEVEDVAQTVLADALASQVIPTDPEELRRWLSGIARHKIADFHRRAARTSAKTNDVDAPENVAATAASPAAFEEREVLEALLNQPRTRRDAETMEWLVREHAGDRLQDIAEENRIAAPVVRQRVSRLRRALRSRYAGAFGLFVLLIGISAFGLHAYEPTEAIAPDPVLDVPAPLAPASATPVGLGKEVSGDWVVHTVTPNRALTPMEKRLIDLQAKSARLHVEGKRVELETANFKMSWTVSDVTTLANGKRRVRITSDSGISENADIVVRRDVNGPRLEVSLHGSRFGGTLLLRRPVL